MSTALTLTTATDADVPRLARFVNRAYRGEDARLGWTTEAHLLDGQRIDEAGVEEMLHLPRATFVLAQDAGGELLGCVHLRACPEHLYLSMLAVDPARQGAGIGRFLLQSAEEHARQQGCPRIRMTVISVRQELLAYYQRQGYQPTGATEPFPTDTRFGIPRQPLELLVLEKEVIFGDEVRK
ncbi:GNAT family N-acetyltransferase [Hymenobacter saemangeumensis]|uniref:GNAT family N-acetyltransferase n=1 Tax=Hymenobacter saemangeumensis TaxID=1084522 RepID=A0ABP8ISR9_9BACT